MAPLLETGQLWRVQLDTYEREVERYGGEAGICLAERVFHADSDAVLAIVRQLTGDAGAELRWRVALRGIDLLFDDLGLTLEQKRAIARRARRGYGSEFGADGDFSREVSRRYRQERASVEALLDPHRDPPSELAASLRGAAPAIHRARAGRAGAARPSGRGTAFRRPLRAGDEPGAYARQPDAALGPASPGTRPLRDARPRLQLTSGPEVLMSDWDSIFGEAALGLDLAKVDPARAGSRQAPAATSSARRASGSGNSPAPACPVVPEAGQPPEGPDGQPGGDLP